MSLCYNTPMMHRLTLPVRCAAAAALVSIAASCAKAPVPLDPAYAAEVEAWRAQRLARLTADDGWLTLTGLYWLEPGENRFGTAADSAVVLPDESLPETAGRLVLGADGTVTAFAGEGAAFEVNGEPLTEKVLATDASGDPDIVTAGRVRFHIIDREGRLAARVKDPEAPRRTGFAGIEHFPIDPAFRVEARLETYDAPREVAIPTVLGEDTTMIATGRLHFSVGGEALTLEPYVESPGDTSFFLIFRDATSGDSTYGAGRFLYAGAPGPDGLTVLDFNLAYNPPCAFTPHATCPLPPPQNWLPVAIEAGEQYHGEAH
jgi:uncharacterized protein (DUF1684 family)